MMEQATEITSLLKKQQQQKTQKTVRATLNMKTNLQKGFG